VAPYQDDWSENLNQSQMWLASANLKESRHGRRSNRNPVSSLRELNVVIDQSHKCPNPRKT
jgi:hypothetical protein